MTFAAPYRVLGLVGLAAVAFVLAACGTTALRSSWTAPDAPKTPIHKMAVFVIHPDKEKSRVAEMIIAQHLGPAAQPGRRLLQPGEEGDKAKVEARLRQLGYDGALTMRVLSVEDRQTYVPPTVMAAPAGVAVPGYARGYGFYNYYGAAYQQVYATPGYMASYKQAVVETIVYSLETNDAIWSGVTETVDPDSPAEAASDIGKVVAAALSKAGVFAKP